MEPEDEVVVEVTPVVTASAKKKRHSRKSQKKRKKESHRGPLSLSSASTSLLVLKGGIGGGILSVPGLKGVSGALSGRLRFIVLNVSVLVLLFFSLFTLLVY